MDIQPEVAEDKITISVYQTRPCNYSNFLKTGINDIPEDTPRVEMDINSDIIPYLGNTFLDHVTVQDDGTYLLNTNEGVEYYDNIKRVIDFINDIVKKIPSEDLEYINSIIDSYHNIYNEQVLINLHRNTIQYGKQKGFLNPVYKKDDKKEPSYISQNHLCNIYDFLLLCNCFGINSGIVCGANWLRFVNRNCNPLQIIDIMDPPSISQDEQERLIKRELYFMDNEDSVLEPTSSELNKYPSYNYNPRLNFDYQIKQFKKQYEKDKQLEQERLTKFKELISTYETEYDRSLTDEEIMTVCNESDILTDDDKAGIILDIHMKNQRIEEFQKEINNEQIKLGRQLTQDELNKLRDESTLLTDGEKALIRFEKDE